MIDVRKQFKLTCDDFSDTYPPEYKQIIDAIGSPIFLVADEDWQGDTRVLFRGIMLDKPFGYLQFGWGSCSGCDALQACNTVADLQALVDELESSTRWGTAEELLAWFREHDWRGDYSWGNHLQRAFVAAVIAFLDALTAPEAK